MTNAAIHQYCGLEDVNCSARIMNTVIKLINRVSGFLFFCVLSDYLVNLLNKIRLHKNSVAPAPTSPDPEISVPQPQQATQEPSVHISMDHIR